MVTNTAFEGLSCYQFYESERDGFAALIAECAPRLKSGISRRLPLTDHGFELCLDSVSIACTTNGELTAEYRSVSLMAWAAIGGYGFGLIGLTAALLVVAHHDILLRKPTSLSRAIHFLYAEYEPWAFWWECM